MAPTSSKHSPVSAGLRRARLAAGLTQQQLADRVGKSRAQIGEWEMPYRCVPTYRNLLALALALGVTVDDLWEDDDQQQSRSGTAQ